MNQLLQYFLYFLLIKAYIPNMSFDIVDLSDANTRKWIYKHKALDISKNIETIWKFIWKVIVLT